MKAVILAGGKGSRLQPYTLVLPKPLMPVGNLPVIEILLKWLRRNGIKEIYITIGYLGKLIRSICSDGSQWDLQIEYSEEPEALGTIGPIQLLKDRLDETFLVLNGDLITDFDLHSFIKFHKERKGLLTIGVTEKEIKVDLGVVGSANGRMTEFQEKPTLKYQVSMGIYCMEPEILKIVPKGVPFGFDDLIFAMFDKDIPVYIFRHTGYWLDIGRHEDFARVQEDFENHKIPNIE